MEPKTELQRNAIAEARRIELDTFQRALDIQWLNSRMEDGRMGRCLALIKREADMEKDFQERTDHAAIVNARAAKETALALEIAKVRHEEESALLRRHYLRERDPTLKELIKKLQAGYVCRDLQQQILHNKYRRLQEKAEENYANSILCNALYNDQEAKVHEEELKMERTSKYCKDLQQQLVNRQLQKQCQYEDSLIEKKMMDDIMRTISDEDQRELRQKREQIVKMRNEMVTFKKAKDAWKEKQKQMVVIEERNIEEQKKAAADRNAAVIAERERVLRMREEMNKKISDKILADEAVKQERENIIKALQEQEHLEKNAQDDIAEKEKSERSKSDTKEALMAQMELRRKLAEQEKEAEARFRKLTEEKMAAEEAKEKEKERKRREKNKEYFRELQTQIEENERRKALDKSQDSGLAKSVFEHDRAWREEVAEERRKIIEEHAPHVLGFLQAGVLQREDLPAVREGANKHEHLAKLDIESMGAVRKIKRFPKCNAQCTVLREY